MTSVTVKACPIVQAKPQSFNRAKAAAVQSTYLDGQNRVDRIDGLRALAVFGVLLIHAQMLTPTPLLAPLAHYGQLGVQLFFFLSGYIIYMAWDRARTGMGGFYWNRLARIALRGTPFEPMADLFTGPTAIAFSADPVAAPKVAVGYARRNERLAIVGGGLGEHVLDPAAVRALAELPPLDELRAKLVGLLNTPASRLIGVLQAPGGQIARVLAAYSEQGTGEQAAGSPSS